MTKAGFKLKKKKDFDFGNKYKARAHSTSVNKPIIDSTSTDQKIWDKVNVHPKIKKSHDDYAKDFFSKKRKGK